MKLFARVYAIWVTIHTPYRLRLATIVFGQSCFCCKVDVAKAKGNVMQLDKFRFQRRRDRLRDVYGRDLSPTYTPLLLHSTWSASSALNTLWVNSHFQRATLRVHVAGSITSMYAYCTVAFSTYSRTPNLKFSILTHSKHQHHSRSWMMEVEARLWCCVAVLHF